MASDGSAKSRRELVTALSAALSVYLYSVGIFLGSRGSPDFAESIARAAPSAGDMAVMFAVSPFMVLPGMLGLPYVWAERPYAIIGTVLAAALFCATYAVLRGRGLRTGWLLVSPLFAYALGYTVEYVLTAYVGVRPPPLSF
jgi:hypothetical protein